MSLIESDYAIRTYGSKDENLNPFDKNLIVYLDQFYTENSDDIKNRKCVVFMDKAEEKIHVEVDPVHSSCICEAIKANGQRCTSKSKPKQSFCGRHLK